MGEADFSGWATKAGIKCSDGRTIQPEAFKHMDGVRVPLVWQHGHSDPDNVLGHAILRHEDGSLRAEGFFNDTPKGLTARTLVEHGDIDSLSIYANQLIEKSKQVFHGVIREVSLVLSGANAGAKIDHVRIAHSDDPDDVTTLDDEATITMGEFAELEHAELEEQPSEDDAEDLEHADTDTVKDVYETLNDEQKLVVNFMLGEALASAGTAAHSDEGDGEQDLQHTNDEGDLEHQEGTTMPRNVFEDAQQDKQGAGTISHANVLTGEQVQTIVRDAAKGNGSIMDSVLAHAEEYGITNIEVLFPDAQTIDAKPEWITRKMEWVEGVLNGARKLPFSRIKSMAADLTHEEARAKGYIKGTMKKEQFFSISQRTTTPKTIYKKQRLDRDDIIDITDFDVVAWLWVEMRFMLREEIARAILIGDGREPDDEDKINEENIRPIATDNGFYTDVITVDANVSPDSLVEAVVRGRGNYKGAGQPTAYMTRSVLNDMLLQRDQIGRRLYRNAGELAAELEVSSIVPVDVMEGATTSDGDLLMVLVNMADYSIGSTRGGEITTFDDFDIDFNQYKYLIEGRMAGALTRAKTAQVVVRAAGTQVTPPVPSFNAGTGVVTIPTATGVVYKNKSTGVTLTAGAQTALNAGQSIEVVATPAAGYHFPHNFDADNVFKRNA